MDNLGYNKIHFIGIGGIGVSAIAKLLYQLGSQITGSDVMGSSITDELDKVGIKVMLGKHKAANIPKDAEMVIYTKALDEKNPELVVAQKSKKPCLSYPEFLKVFMGNYWPILVTGTHGKSTTTGMLTVILESAGLDPMAIIGTKVVNYRSNVKVGLGKYLVLEGDEYREAFLNYSPMAVIINNIEADHLDYYQDEAHVVSAFSKLVKKIPDSGLLVANHNDQNVNKVIADASCKVITFGLDKGDYHVANVYQQGEITKFSVNGLEQFDLRIRVPGLHNVANALAAAVMAIALGIDIEKIKKGILQYQGAWRRFELKGEINGITIIDDYAHHPTEVKAALKTAREMFPNKKIWCVYQPHSISRTKKLINNFLDAFDDCDELIMTDIYLVAGREKTQSVDVTFLADKIKMDSKSLRIIHNYRSIAKNLQNKLGKDDVVITMGAGNITEVSDQLIKLLKNKENPQLRR